MRNWNERSMWLSRCLMARLPDYLWGIETPFESPAHCEEPASRLPMRNWNSQSGASPVSIELPDYLWGIETSVLEFFQAPWCASRLPMRNWNHVVIPFYFNQRDRFQTTYEELKLGEGRSKTEIIVASRLPMRNWNRSLPLAGLWSLRFQTTYEELKRGSIAVVGFDLIVLPDYLWGIETDGVLKALDSQERASRLPMRNWNADECRRPLSLAPGFQTTYEELKHVRSAI